jgi:hypothetical protein
MELLTKTYSKKVSFQLSCYDRIILTGTLPDINYAQEMTKYLYDYFPFLGDKISQLSFTGYLNNYIYDLKAKYFHNVIHCKSHK